MGGLIIKDEWLEENKPTSKEQLETVRRLVKRIKEDEANNLPKPEVIIGDRQLKYLGTIS